MNSLDDTIAAIATPLGVGGIGIVRISGPEARGIVNGLFVASRSAREMRPGEMRHGWVVEPGGRRRLDEVLAVWFAAPQTYTRQDVAEIHCHGGAVGLRRVLAAVLARGARAAEAGEFTLRAFANGRIDLAQAEAVAEVVRARTEAGLRQAVTQLDGALSGRVREARERTLGALAFLEASIDFPVDEIPPEDALGSLRGALEIVESLLSEADRGIVVREGVRVAIVGRPNVGKSSLLNALLRADRAIVTEIAGTTRDTLEETANMGGVPVVLVDTAGITNGSVDAIERLGIERSRRAVAAADLCLLVVDGSEPLVAQDREVAEATGGRRTIVVVNKSDLPARAELGGYLPSAPRVAVSALCGAGLGDLERSVVEIATGGPSGDAEPLVASARHKDALRRAGESLRMALGSLDEELPWDLVCIDVRGAVEALGEITGETVGEELVSSIFARFCVGK